MYKAGGARPEGQYVDSAKLATPLYNTAIICQYRPVGNTGRAPMAVDGQRLCYPLSRQRKCHPLVGGREIRRCRGKSFPSTGSAPRWPRSSMTGAEFPGHPCPEWTRSRPVGPRLRRTRRREARYFSGAYFGISIPLRCIQVPKHQNDAFPRR